MQTFDPNALSSETMTLDELIHALPAEHRDLAWLGVRAFMMHAVDCAAAAIRVRPTSQPELDKICPFDPTTDIESKLAYHLWCYGYAGAGARYMEQRARRVRGKETVSLH